MFKSFKSLKYYIIKNTWSYLGVFIFSYLLLGNIFKAFFINLLINVFYLGIWMTLELLFFLICFYFAVLGVLAKGVCCTELPLYSCYYTLLEVASPGRAHCALASLCCSQALHLQSSSLSWVAWNSLHHQASICRRHGTWIDNLI